MSSTPAPVPSPAPAPAPAAAPLLSVEGLKIAYPDGRGSMRCVVDDVSFEIGEAELVGVVGGSGSGKSTTLRAVLGHLAPRAEMTEGNVRLGDVDLIKDGSFVRSAGRGRDRRRDDVAVIVQDPSGALNPLRTVGDQMRRLMRDRGREVTDTEMADSLAELLIPSPKRVLSAHPYELSGGMAQRVLVAIALLLRPKLLLADEPTSALDVTSQAQIMELLHRLVAEHGMSVALVTHDLALVSENCDRIVVMRQGKVVDSGTTREVLYTRAGEYSSALVRAATHE